ncbi:MAG: hypothetical protein DHS20C15_09710 [Planctomycetota bacterium]|nr:MAG: hypothetical protein DHS20C15_09710 [Planctomycetota bacterium]
MTVLAAGIVLHRPGPDGPQLLLLRNRDNGHWGLPKGRRDEGDAHEIATAQREVLEETGWDGLRLHRAFRVQQEYVVRGSSDDGRLKRVVYFLAAAPGERPTLSEEHESWCWAGAEELEELLAYEKLREVARAAVAALTPATA